jgi:hypothetical protein
MNKQELIAAMKNSRQQFTAALEGIPEEAMLEPGLDGEWSVKDLLLHLTMWEAELIQMLWQVQQGTKPTTAHFQRTEMDQLNQQWQQENRERALDMVWNDFRGVRSQTIRRVEAMSDADLKNVERYPWLKGRALWKWVAGDTFEHEAEHLKQIQEWKGQRGF